MRSPAEALTNVLNRLFALDKRMDAMAADAFPIGYQDVVYKGHKIIIGAGETYAVFKNRTAIKTKFGSVEQAKNWIDKQ